MGSLVLIALLIASMLTIIQWNHAFGSSFEVTDVTAPELASATSWPLCSVRVGQQELVITSLLRNLSDEEMKFTAIIEVRDSEGVTQSLNSRSGTIQDHRVQVGVPWVPAQAGELQLRVLVISGFVEPQVLSKIKTSNVEIVGPNDPC